MDQRIRHLRNYEPKPSRYEAARLRLLDLAPELRQAPLYLITAPPDYPRGCYGAFHMRRPDAAIREALILSGQWEGPGNIIVLGRDFQGEELTGILAHEGAHCLPFCPFDFDDRAPTKAEAEREAEAVAAWASSPPVSGPPWEHSHGLQFVRRVLHLHYRAERSGVSVPLPTLHCAGPHYGLSGLWKYKRALGNEPERFMGATFGEIEATAVPSDFQLLFDSDLAAWNKTEAKRQTL
ncbi:MAG: hypothetical protein K8T91_25655 [Planctomycetes bacterium]|nr:hypothetical protein [Planctomycetota bacterium]